MFQVSRVEPWHNCNSESCEFRSIVDRLPVLCGTVRDHSFFMDGRCIRKFSSLKGGGGGIPKVEGGKGFLQVNLLV